MSTPSMPFDDDGREVPVLKPGGHQSKECSGTAGTIDAAVGSSVIRVVSTTACYITIGDGVTADTADVYLPADQPEYFKAEDGTDVVSAVQVSNAGTIHVTDMD